MTDDELGELKLDQAIRWYDFSDRSIIVGPPANVIECPAMVGLLKSVVNSS